MPIVKFILIVMAVASVAALISAYCFEGQTDQNLAFWVVIGIPTLAVIIIAIRFVAFVLKPKSLIDIEAEESVRETKGVRQK